MVLCHTARGRLALAQPGVPVSVLIIGRGILLDGLTDQREIFRYTFLVEACRKSYHFLVDIATDSSNISLYSNLFWPALLLIRNLVELAGKAGNFWDCTCGNYD